jgi:FSR family fosmidomycin resistance protein-like MFS transporter
VTVAEARQLPGADAAPDRGGLVLLGAGHFVIDMTVGALAAFVAAFTEQLHLSNLAASMIVGTSTLASSAIQPLFGLHADRRPSTPFLWGGVVLAGAGLAAAGLAGSYELVIVCVAASGLGVAAFHPEAARVASVLAGARRATGMAWFSVGGNFGFAAGPFVAAAFLPLMGLRATLVFLVPAVAVGALLLARRSRVSPPPAGAGGEAAGPAQLGATGLLVGVVVLRTWVQFGLLTIGPLLLVHERGYSDVGAAIALGAFAFAGALGTLAGGVAADRVGGRALLAISLPLAAPCVAGFLLVPGAGGVALLAAAGFLGLASFSATVVMGQEYMPGRPALAAGLMIGFAAIGSAAPGLALLGALADAAGRDAAIWAIAALAVAAGALALLLPRPAGRVRT